MSQTAPIISRNAEIVQKCSSSSAFLSAGNGGYSYSWLPTANLSSTNTYSTNASPSSNTVYTVTASSGTCSTTETISVLCATTNTAAEFLYVKDGAADVGNVPDYDVPNGWTSSDIWINTTPALNQGPGVGSSIEYNTSGTPAYIHVIVTNSATTSGNATGVLKVYYQKDGAPLWLNCTSNGTLALADQIGGPIPITIANSSSVEIVIPWIVPDPALFASYSPNDYSHFCILAFVETGCNALATHTTQPPSATVWNEKIAARNIHIVDNYQDKPPRGPWSSLLVAHNNLTTTPVKYVFNALANDNGQTIFDHCSPYVQMRGDLYDLWIAGGEQGSNVTKVGNNTIMLTGNNATIENIEFPPDSISGMAFKYLFTSQASTSYSFEVDVIQYENDTTLRSGNRYVIAPAECLTLQVKNDTLTMPVGCAVTLEIDSPVNGAEYEWHDENGYIGSEEQKQVTPPATSTYTLTGYLNGCVQTATALVIVLEDGRCEGRLAKKALQEKISTIFSIVPNPAYDQVTINFVLNENEKYDLLVSNALGQEEFRTSLNSKETSMNLDCMRFSNGLYYVSLVANGKVYKTSKLVIVK